MPPTARHGLDLQRREGWERQSRTVTRGPQQPAAPQRSLRHSRTVKEAEPNLLYKKLPRFIALKTHITLEA